MTPESVPSLHGFVRDEGRLPHRWEDPFFEASSLVARVDDPAYRKWKIAYLLYKLEAHGFAPGDSPCFTLSYKPGWHMYYDEAAHGPSFDPCAVPGSGQWTGPAHLCREDRERQPGGRLDPTQYGPGEFEGGLSAFMLELIRAAEAHGYRNPRIITTERPLYRRLRWAALSPALRSHPALLGEKGQMIEPRLSLLGRRDTGTVATPTPGPTPPSPTPDEGPDPDGPIASPTPDIPTNPDPIPSPDPSPAERPEPTPTAGGSGSGPRSWSLGSGGAGDDAQRSRPEMRRSTGGGGGGTVEHPDGR